MSHDTSRHTERAFVACSSCGRQLRGEMDFRGRWHVRRHRVLTDMAKWCWGHHRTDHRLHPDPT